MPKSALSDRLNDPTNWKGTDDDNWLMRWRIPLKGLFAYGPRATEWWARWREFPRTLLAIRSKQGGFRLETETWERDSVKEQIYTSTKIINSNLYMEIDTPHPNIIYYAKAYLSRVQYYTRWHFAIQWPFLIQFHFYFKAKDVQIFGHPREESKGKLFFFYLGAHRDADKVYWFPSAFIGLCWK